MSEKFNPAQHMVKLQGRDYLPVAAALAWANIECSDLHISTDILVFEPTCVIKAVVSLGNKSAVAHASGQLKGQKALEKLETTAIGRAVRMLGYGTLQAGDELEEAPYDMPSEPTPPKSKINDQASAERELNRVLHGLINPIFEKHGLNYGFPPAMSSTFKLLNSLGIKGHSFAEMVTKDRQPDQLATVVDLALALDKVFKKYKLSFAKEADRVNVLDALHKHEIEGESFSKMLANRSVQQLAELVDNVLEIESAPPQ